MKRCYWEVEHCLVDAFVKLKGSESGAPKNDHRDTLLEVDGRFDICRRNLLQHFL